jgi:WD40 repeat protein/energy-coupling factor transporter ATP-binding protein EcfA2
MVRAPGLGTLAAGEIATEMNVGDEREALALEWPRNPFPGLRPFREDECLIFYGRNSQKDEVLARLNQSQLVFVTGPSGCGKSSLIKAGVLPALRAGLLTKAGYRWKILQMRPGRDPLSRLAAEFEAAAPAHTAGPEGGGNLENLVKTEESALWLAADSIAPASRDPDARAPARLLLVIDQFEEIFGQQIQDPQDVDRFVRLLVRFAQRPHPNLFLIVTMRTDFLGQCANFEGLAECINRSQFLTPVLTEEELGQAIARPAEDYNGEVEPALVDQIIRDMRTGSAYHTDSLPLMQHALLWLWTNSWKRGGCNGPPRPMLGDTSPRTRLTLEMYRESDGIAGILNRHAEDVLTEAVGHSKEHRNIAQELFRRLSERDSEGRYRRSPTSADNIRIIAGCTLEQLLQVIKPFEHPDVCFLEQRHSADTGEALVDLSHESLIRQWHTAKAWADTEAEKLRYVRNLIGFTRAWEENGRSNDFLKRKGELEVIQTRWRRETPSADWARRYGLAEEFPRVEKYLGVSSETDSAEKRKEQREREEKAAEKSLRQRNRNMGIAAFLLFVSIVVTVFAYIQKQENNRNRAGIIALMADEATKIYGPARGLLVAMQGIKESLPQLPAMERAAYRALAQLREQRILKEDNEPAGLILSAQFDPKDRPVLIAAQDGWLKFWNPDKGELIDKIPFGGRYLTASWNSSGSELFISPRDAESFFLSPCSRGRLREFFPGCGPTQADDIKRKLNSDNGGGGGVFSLDGRWVVTGNDTSSFKLWDVTKIDAPVRDFNVIGSYNVSAAFSHDSKRLALGTSSGCIQIFDVSNILTESGMVLSDRSSSSADNCRASGGHVVTSVAFHPRDPDVLLATHQDGAVRLWNVAKRQSKPLGVQSGMVFQGAFNQSGDWAAIAHEDRTVRLWRLTADDPHPQVLRGHEGMVFAVAYNSANTPDEMRIASGSSDGTVRIWSQQSALARKGMNSSEPISLSGEARVGPRGREFALNYNDRDILLTTPPSAAQAAGGANIPIAPRAAAVSPSGKDAVVVPSRGRPYLFNLESKEYIVMLPGPPEAWRSVGFLRNARPGPDETALQIVGITDDGRKYRWPYFEDLKELKRFADGQIPFDGSGKRVEINPDVVCRIEGKADSECPSGEDSPPE